MDDNTVKDVRNLFKLKKESKAIKIRIIRDIQNLFEHEKEYYYKPIRAGNFWSNNYIEYQSNSDRFKTLVEEYFNKVRSYLKDIINNHKKFDTWKNQLTIAINDKQCVMHSKSYNIGITINDKADEIIEKLFESLLNI